LPASLALSSTGINNAISSAIIAITTKSSIKVNAFRFCMAILLLFQENAAKPTFDL
jgi:hypothetical protein